MHIENMHTMIEELTSCTKEAIENNETCVGSIPIPDVIDMIKDLNTASYYASVVKAMQESDEEQKESEKYVLRQLVDEYGEDTGRRYYDNYRYANGRFAPKGRGTRRGYEEPPYWHLTPEEYREWAMYRDIDRNDGRMYFSEPVMHESKNIMDTREESRYDARKRAYTETKEAHKDSTPESKQARMKDLEAYMQELTSDLSGMIADMTPEEKQLAKQKISVLASKF